MKATNLHYIASGVVIMCLPLAVAAQNRDGVLYVPAKKIPLPTDVSPRLRQLISQPVPPIPPTPTTDDGWRKVQR